MENGRQVGVSSSSITLDLFGPKDSSSSSSSTGLFGTVFPPPSTVLGRTSSHSGFVGSSRKQDFGNQYGNAKYGTRDYNIQGSKGENSGIAGKEKISSIYQNETVLEPCSFSSSIYYGGQDVYYPQTRTAESHPTFKNDGGEDDPNGSNSNGASRGNWWQGSLYY
ncbi:hypothetical protein L1049_010971 [Liquidambar formosana]|uniref:Uncharacterized protein n=1 Tax=Liquidambar formosana TaxID=63359 RepID=A0AAP0RR11_LIQFO